MMPKRKRTRLNCGRTPCAADLAARALPCRTPAVAGCPREHHRMMCSLERLSDRRGLWNDVARPSLQLPRRRPPNTLCLSESAQESLFDCSSARNPVCCERVGSGDAQVREQPVCSFAAADRVIAPPHCLALSGLRRLRASGAVRFLRRYAVLRRLAA